MSHDSNDDDTVSIGLDTPVDIVAQNSEIVIKEAVFEAAHNVNIQTNTVTELEVPLTFVLTGGEGQNIFFIFVNV